MATNGVLGSEKQESLVTVTTTLLKKNESK